MRVRERIEPEPGWASAYDDGYARYSKLYPALRSLRGR